MNVPHASNNCHLFKFHWWIYIQSSLVFFFGQTPTMHSLCQAHGSFLFLCYWQMAFCFLAPYSFYWAFTFFSILAQNIFFAILIFFSFPYEFLYAWGACIHMCVHMCGGHMSSYVYTYVCLCLPWLHVQTHIYLFLMCLRGYYMRTMHCCAHGARLPFFNISCHRVPLLFPGHELPILRVLS